MHIPINKDPEEAYKAEAIRGFTLREAGCIALAVAASGGIAAFAWFQFGVSPDIGIYAGLPFAAPILLFGFCTKQGLTMGKYVKEIIYERQTRILTYDAGELPKEKELPRFSLQSKSRRFCPWTNKTLLPATQKKQERLEAGRLHLPSLTSIKRRGV